jgi:hypothetical protein
MSQLLISNIMNATIVTFPITPPAVGANATVAQTATVNGVLPGDFIEVNPLVISGNLVISESVVTSANTISIHFSNPTASAISAGTLTNYYCLVFRPDSTQYSVRT